MADGCRSAAGVGSGAVAIAVAAVVAAVAAATTGAEADGLRSSPSYLGSMDSRMCQRKAASRVATRTQDSAGGPHGARRRRIQLGMLEGRDK